jgi:hypothetical protein
MRNQPEDQTIRNQMRRESARLAMVAYLRAHETGEATMAEIAQAIGETPTLVARIVGRSPMTFSASHVISKRGREKITVQLHRHLAMAVA